MTLLVSTSSVSSISTSRSRRLLQTTINNNAFSPNSSRAPLCRRGRMSKIVGTGVMIATMIAIRQRKRRIVKATRMRTVTKKTQMRMKRKAIPPTAIATNNRSSTQTHWKGIRTYSTTRHPHRHTIPSSVPKPTPHAPPLWPPSLQEDNNNNDNNTRMLMFISMRTLIPPLLLTHTPQQ